MEDICDAGLVLALGYEKKSPTADVGVHRTKLDTSSLHSSDSLEPSLTLGRQSSSPHSTLSSHSNVKRERDDVGGEEVDRLSSPTNDNDDDGSGNRKKLRLTKEQSALLEERFKEHSTLNPKQKAALAKQLNLRPRQVEVWFQNRRARTKLKQTEVDCELLKKYCDMLTEDNRRLQMEVQELKALHLAPTFYVQQRPVAGAATVTICASCRRIGKAHDSPNAAA